MQKLTLNVDELRIETLVIGTGEKPREGTVLAGASLVCTETRNIVCP
jgi:hypothetical protein